MDKITRQESVREIQWVTEYGFKPDKNIIGYENIENALHLAISELSKPEIVFCKDCENSDMVQLEIGGEKVDRFFCKKHRVMLGSEDYCSPGLGAEMRKDATIG